MRNLICLVVLSGCGLSVEGEVDGEPLLIRSGYFVQDSRVEGEHVLQVVFSNATDGCDLDGRFLVRTDELTDPQELASAAAELLPADRWVINATLQVDDVAALGEGDRFDVVPPSDWGLGEVVVGFQRYSKLLDAEFWERPQVRPLYVTERQSGEGSLSIEGFETGTKMQAVLDSTLVEIDDTDEVVGDVELDFTIRRCRTVETYLFDLPTLNESAPG